VRRREDGDASGGEQQIARISRMERMWSFLKDRGQRGLLVSVARLAFVPESLFQAWHEASI